MPPDTVSVTRPGRFGNPFKAEDAVEAGYRDGPGMAAWAFRQWLIGAPDFDGQFVERRTFLRRHLPELRGKNLACWCEVGKPCHADVLLKLANAPTLSSEERS